ncbi:phosphatidylserine decarboxylase family protein [Tepidibacillus fermentans]|uniref:Phosphatidylserine decarboxylase proenzyme n=1 Tax=Tepidibacillus fermentans TaxID=1281767 RepID=A0A4R3KEC1_9BACI|nr:phosphatidylserine decarboxylase family protein [Tepidibacillus fermentans]TCS81577.1 phosphatidylserine decarboxylase [Tepidibacillus fermentans]
MKDHVLIREGLPTLGVLLIFTVILYLLYPALAVIGIGLILFVLFFFRDPKRNVIIDDKLVLAPADGLITNIEEVEENQYLKDKAIRVSIFMSPFDVHVNRSPISGTVDYLAYRKGKFISATKPESHDVNEKNLIGITNGRKKVLVVQIAGIMARRIVNWTKIQQKLEQGEKIGMIKFSSGTQLFLPRSTEIMVKKGDKIQAGKTIIGRFSND